MGSKMRVAAISLALTILSVFSAPAAASAAVQGPYKFDSNTLRFGGTVAETAACLLRKVKEQGSGAEAQPIPAWLGNRVTRPVPFTVEQVRRYLSDNAIDVAELTNRVVLGDTPTIRYFVIHDTSWPESIPAGSAFSRDINEASWSGNRLSGWVSVARKVNLIISRDGRSRRLQEWGAIRPSPATKIEQNNYVPAARRVFVHVENVQPRIKPAGSWAWKAPTPGFGPAQEKRLALAYVVASLRAGRWLIPAYHFNIDQGLPGAHDDPQHADLDSWVNEISTIEAAILR